MSLLADTRILYQRYDCCPTMFNRLLSTLAASSTPTLPDHFTFLYNWWLKSIPLNALFSPFRYPDMCWNTVNTSCFPKPFKRARCQGRLKRLFCSILIITFSLARPPSRLPPSAILSRRWRKDLFGVSTSFCTKQST